MILALLGEKDFDFEEVFIDGNEELEVAYGLRVPVVLVDGSEEFETRVETDLLRGLLEETRTGEIENLRKGPSAGTIEADWTNPSPSNREDPPDT